MWHNDDGVHNMNEIKPCPFCGKRVDVWQNDGYGTVRVIECRDCRVRFVFAHDRSETLQDLAKNWNRRAGE